MRMACGGKFASFMASAVPVLDPASSDAAAIRHLFAFVSLICLVIFVVVVALICVSLVRSRAAKGKIPMQNFGNRRAEIAWTIPPVLIVGAFAVISAKLILSSAAVPAPQGSAGGDADVVVIGHQWWWE